MREVLLNCRIEADEDGVSLVQDVADYVESVAVCLIKQWRDGEKVRVIVERLPTLTPSAGEGK